MITSKKLENIFSDTLFINQFKSFCDKNSSLENRKRLRNILYISPNPPQTVTNLFRNEMNANLSPEEANRMYQLLIAFLNKSSYRKNIEDEVKEQLLYNQGHKCAICNCPIDMHSHADHIIPFKYVGDELENNLQMLCSSCNKSKNANIDYHIRYLLN